MVRHQVGNALPRLHLCLLPGDIMDSELVFTSLLDPGDQSQNGLLCLFSNGSTHSKDISHGWVLAASLL